MIAEAPPVTDYSQRGEASTVIQFLGKLPTRDGWCVDVGAGTGWSNTRNLIEAGYRAILFDADPKECEKLRQSFPENVEVCCATVDTFIDRLIEDFSGLESIPSDFDFVSIDIDGNDYHVWKAMTGHQPKIVCIEFNPTIPTEVHFVQPADMNVMQGSSLYALVQLGKEKGYELAAVHPFNAIFVRKDLYHFLGIPNNDPRVLRQDLGFVTFMFTGYDGTLFLAGNERLPWHPVQWDAAKMQPLPRWFRKYPWNYGKAQRRAFNLWNFGRQVWSVFRKCLTASSTSN